MPLTLALLPSLCLWGVMKKNNKPCLSVTPWHHQGFFITPPGLFVKNTISEHRGVPKSGSFYSTTPCLREVGTWEKKKKKKEPVIHIFKQMEFFWDSRWPRTKLTHEKLSLWSLLFLYYKPTDKAPHINSPAGPGAKVISTPKPTQPRRIRNSTCTGGCLIKAHRLHLTELLPFRKLKVP